MVGFFLRRGDVFSLIVFAQVVYFPEELYDLDYIHDDVVDGQQQR
jgi:hypothetical protein